MKQKKIYSFFYEVPKIASKSKQNIHQKILKNKFYLSN